MMKRLLLVLLLTAAAILVACTPARKDETANTTTSFTPTQTLAKDFAAWQAFNRQYNEQWRVEWNRLTGTPHRIYGHRLPTTAPTDRESAAETGRRLLADMATVLRIQPDQLQTAGMNFEPPHNQSARGTWYLSYQQTYKQLPVVGGTARLVIRGNQVTLLGADFYRGIQLSPAPAISLEQAIRGVRTEARPLKPVSSRLVVMPIAAGERINYHLAWDFTMPAETTVAGNVANSGAALPKTGKQERMPQPEERIPVQYRYFVDAHTGKLLERRNEMVYEDLDGGILGSIYPFDPTTPQETRPISGLTITADQGGPPFTVQTDDTGHYNLTGLSAGNVDFNTHFENPTLRVWNNETPDPDATHAATAIAPGTHDWDWASDDPSPGDVETHTFYHLHHIQEWFQRGAPFNVLPDPNPMQAFVRDGAYCNAGAGPAGLSFGSGGASCEDFALCADIIYHEYTHRIVQKIYDSAGVSLPYSGQTGAMNEAWADYFGSTNTGAPTHGTGCYTGRHLDSPDKRFPEDWIGEVHADGLIFGGALWDTRDALGADYTDILAMRAMKDTAVSFSEYLGALLEEDDDPAISTDPGAANNNPADGTPNISAICHAWNDLHGVFHPYCVGYTDNLIATITLPDQTIRYNHYDNSDGSVVIEGSALGSSTVSLQSYTIEYAHQSAPDTWATAGVTLAGGGTAPVNSGLLGQINIAGLSDGMYLIRLTVTGTDSSTISAVSSFVLDNTLKNGWPQETGRYFRSSPTVADIDPGTPGLEIINLDTWGSLHIWHQDGSIMTGWPKYFQTSRATPAVADIDNDGSLDIVIAGNGGQVRVYNPDGSTRTGWPITVSSGEPLSTTVLEDLDGDGVLEIISASEDGNIYAWHSDGTTVTGWPVTAGTTVQAAPAAGDIDADGQVEVIVGTEDGTMHVWRGDGTMTPGWPVTVAGAAGITGSAALGDLDNDGDLEIVVGTHGNVIDTDNQVYAWHHNGSSVTGWPQAFDSPPVYGGFQMSPSSVDLADLDDDGELEVVIMSNNDHVHIWEADGTAKAGWPPSGPGGGFYEFIVSSPVIADIDGDGDQEIIFEANKLIVGPYNAFVIYAYHHDGTLVAGWPRVINSYSNSSPTIADLDGDGTVEVLIGSGGLFIWDLPGSYTRSSPEWPFYRDDNRRTGMYGPVSSITLLMDTSGSMSWQPDGTMTGPAPQKRINLAREAVYPFMELLNDFGAVKTNFAIAAFPAHPFTGCTAETITPMTLVTPPAKTQAVGTTLPGLVTGGSTPLLAGMEEAISLFNDERHRAIVLLSDGYHNCPSLVSVGDPEVTDLIGKLQDEDIRVFTIGFGRPTDVDHPLLETLANETTPAAFTDSQFYDVTTPSFDPASWDPATALQATYKNILVDALDLDTTLDPLGTIRGGESQTHNTQLTPHDRKVSFFVSWKTPRPDLLQVTVKASDGTVLTTGMSGVTVHGGKTYHIVTVDHRLLRKRGKVTGSPWQLTVLGDEFRGNEPYQYSVIVDSSLHMAAGTDKDGYLAGDDILITARLTENGKPLTGMRDVYARISGPQAALGNWFVEHYVDQAELRKVPDTIGEEALLPWQRKVHYLTTIRKVPLPGVKETTGLQLFDDGSHGDIRANDGIYTNIYHDTQVAGTYRFHITAAGSPAKPYRFTRDTTFQKRVAVGIATALPRIEVNAFKDNRAVLTVYPRDRFGNILAPGQSARLDFRVENGKLEGKAIDAVNGGYRINVTVADSIKPEQLRIRPRIKRLKLQKWQPAPAGRNPGSLIRIERSWQKAYLRLSGSRAMLLAPRQ